MQLLPHQRWLLYPIEVDHPPGRVVFVFASTISVGVRHPSWSDKCNNQVTNGDFLKKDRLQLKKTCSAVQFLMELRFDLKQRILIARR